MMEKSRSYPQYSSSYSGEFGFRDRPNAYTFNGPTNKDLGLASSDDNRELKRKKRIASYNMFTTEGKLKSSLRDSFKWIKNKFTETRYGL
ncbi:Protein TIC like [Actinidia chinensis var. chinensis]|uniref:Protein TIC like n=1 Tax=Actinidia chinensis var. chinensis TaxID=1590841 RepID=A0A2R6RNV0_ACTCC|nr:Protein TIC like [Actinidia chinensis var. chinensis]